MLRHVEAWDYEQAHAEVISIKRREEHYDVWAVLDQLGTPKRFRIVCERRTSGWWARPGLYYRFPDDTSQQYVFSLIDQARLRLLDFVDANSDHIDWDALVQALAERLGPSVLRRIVWLHYPRLKTPNRYQELRLSHSKPLIAAVAGAVAAYLDPSHPLPNTSDFGNCFACSHYMQARRGSAEDGEMDYDPVTGTPIGIIDLRDKKVGAPLGGDPESPLPCDWCAAKSTWILTQSLLHNHGRPKLPMAIQNGIRMQDAKDEARGCDFFQHKRWIDRATLLWVQASRSVERSQDGIRSNVREYVATLDPHRLQGEPLVK